MAGTGYPFAIKDTEPGALLDALQLPPDTLALLRCGNAWPSLARP